MSTLYRVNEIFTSVQGEGVWTGKVATFVRMSGCNLCCIGCDTDHHAHIELTTEQIVQRVLQDECKLAIITGGEPLTQDVGELCTALKREGKYVHLETNGWYPLPEDVDWVACSPKVASQDEVDKLHGLKGANEVKVPVHSYYKLVNRFGIPSWSNAEQVLWVQPWWEGGMYSVESLRQAISLVRSFPFWRLCIQMHKFIHIR